MPRSIYGGSAVAWATRAERVVAEAVRRARGERETAAANDPAKILTQGVFSPLTYGAVGDGVTDDGAAIRDCLVKAREWASATVEELTPRIPRVDFGGLVYATSIQIEVPGGQGMDISNGALVPAAGFTSALFLMRIGDPADPIMRDGFRNANTTIRRFTFDNQHVGGGLLLENFQRVTVDESCLFLHYETVGLKTTKTGSHELRVSGKTQFAEYLWGETEGVGYDRADLFVGTAVEINSSDNHLSDLVIQLSKIGLKVNAQANLFDKIHIWTGYVKDPLTAPGPTAALTYLSTGLWITANASFNTFSQLYMDGCEILWEDPWKTTIADSIFLNGYGDAARAFIRFKPMSAGRFVNGCVVTGCSFQVQAEGLMRMATVDTSAGTFAGGEFTDCVIDGNNFTGVTPVYSTIRTRLSQDGASVWTFNLGPLCAFGAAVQGVHMTPYQYGGGTNLFRVTSVLGSDVVVTSFPVATPATPGNTNATVYLEATINKPNGAFS